MVVLLRVWSDVPLWCLKIRCDVRTAAVSELLTIGAAQV